MAPLPGRVTFEAFELDLERATLRRSGRVLKLRPQPMRVLCLLVSEAGKPVARETSVSPPTVAMRLIMLGCGRSTLPPRSRPRPIRISAP